ncbi:hypothetical protein AAL_07262 [Moelleriella libera RCEF 2490]|uniref:Cell wall galactomannoprotein n=1 Tax=Moelleriella libera RCEF 2490 TaxID=1081109 RepID=A0A167XJK7_9HYPO|nr:hypothetical protein AAL_07262 [Moelleriella libera RCEF 2490]
MKFFGSVVVAFTCVSAVIAVPAPVSNEVATASENVARMEPAAADIVSRMESAADELISRMEADPSADANALVKRETIAEAAASLAKNIVFLNPMGIASAAVRLAGAIVATATGTGGGFGKRSDLYARDAIQDASEALEKSIASKDVNAIQASILQLVDSIGPVNSTTTKADDATNTMTKRASIADAALNMAKAIVSLNPIDIAKTAVQLAGAIVGRSL